MTAAILNALADEVEAAEGPSRELDERIADALFERSHFAQLADAPIPTGCMMWWQDGHQQSALRYSSSLDAAVTLVPDCYRAGVLHAALKRIQETGFPTSTFLHRLICEIVAQALRARAVQP